jgi:cytosine/adenosine deaminase-related metal-dependent hydrolase
LITCKLLEIKGDTIVGITPSSNVATTEDDQVINLEGNIVLPPFVERQAS